jgi:hypothetical protein
MIWDPRLCIPQLAARSTETQEVAAYHYILLNIGSILGTQNYKKMEKADL